MTGINLFQIDAHIDLKFFIPVSLSIAIVCSIFVQYIWFAIPVILAIYLLVIYGLRFYLFFVIVSLLTLVGEVNTSLRLVVQIIAFSGLSFLFLRRYGLEFKKYPIVPSLLLKFLAFFYTVMILSTIFSNYPLTGLIQIIKISIFFYLMYLLYSFIKTREDINLYIKSLFIASVIMALSTFINFVGSGFNLVNLATAHLRTGGLLGNVNAIGGYYAVVIPIAITFLFYKKPETKRIYLIGLIVIFSVGMLIVVSRSAIISVITSLVFILFYLNKKYFKILITCLIILLLCYLFVDPINEFVSVVLRVERGLTRRDYLWQISTGMIKDNFWFGVGPGSWGKEMFTYFPVLLNSFKGKLFVELYEQTGGFNNSHNFYLVFFSDMGIFGLFTAFFFPFVFFKIGFQTIKRAKTDDKNLFLLAVGITAVGAGMFLRGFFEGISLITIGRIAVDIPFWTLFIILIYLNISLSHLNPDLKGENHTKI